MPWRKYLNEHREYLPAIAPIGDVPREVWASWLAEWQRRNGFSNDAAAARLGLSVRAWLRQKSGRTGVPRQTILLAFYVSVHRHNWLEIAELALSLARMNTEH